MVPKGWKRVPIKDVCESIIDCVNKTAPVVDYETPFKMIRTTNVRNGRVNTEDVRYVTEDTYLQWVRRGKPQVGDIIFTREAPVGEAGVLQDAEGIFLGQRTMMYRADTCLSDNYFLFYSLSSPFCQKQIEDFSNGGTVAHMRVPDCGEILINLPPFLEQKKIAQILSTWDKAISVTEKLLTNSQQQKKALMQQLLTGKKRLPDENGVSFSGAWKWLRAAELFKTISQKNNSEDEELLAVTQDLGVIPRSMLERRVVMPDGSTKGYKLVVPGNFIISLRSFQGGLEYSRYRGLVSPAYTVLTPIKKIVDEFYKQYYKSYDFIGHLAVAVIGIRDGKQISYEDFSFLKLPYPEIEEQQKIAAVLSAADAEISTLEKKLACLRDEKKALMQQLLTGKRRVKVDEAVAE
ncbi:TPA: restriction endonuclease subunit S [Escherichia coli]|nr:restriction endonuclease subunit S [Escherichia coli]HBL0924537.1 restriction endonuclease subunit S [Escherichia coli]HBM8975434.1 restriction endonuclease subunit S [Escherichia coli]HCD4416885.1 restriction endonuclease subunit S [Escherichia coli]HCY2262924.1 restriction endonuclease subunit S [Escherichia coli]